MRTWDIKVPFVGRFTQVSFNTYKLMRPLLSRQRSELEVCMGRIKLYHEAPGTYPKH